LQILKIDLKWVDRLSTWNKGQPTASARKGKNSSVDFW